MSIRFRRVLSIRFVALLAAAASLGFAAPAQADCFGSCYDNYASCSASGLLQGQCAGQRDICLQQCRTSGAPSRGAVSAVPSANWAYIVYDARTGISGTASGTPDGQAAMARARAQCTKRGGQACDFRLSARDGCVAIAGGAGGSGTAGWQTSRGSGGRPVVRQRVLEECRRLGGRQCAIRTEVCSWD